MPPTYGWCRRPLNGRKGIIKMAREVYLNRHGHWYVEGDGTCDKGHYYEESVMHVKPPPHQTCWTL